MKSNMPYSPMAPVLSQEYIEGGKLLCRVPRQVTETAEGEGESSHFAEMKALQLALDIAE